MNDNAIPTPATPVIPSSMCDIVLKGGLTSGVVYPLALARLAENFRFSNIGGTSAGAIAAAAAAAAEYGRQTGGGLGFARLEEIPEEIGPHLLALFQPTPVLKPVYDTFIALLNALPALAPIAAPVTRYWGTALLGLVARLRDLPLRGCGEQLRRRAPRRRRHAVGARGGARREG